MVRTPSRPQLGWLLAAAVPVIALMVGGCDTDAGRADKRVQEDLAQAAADPARAGHELDAAANEKSASLPYQLRAKAMLGDRELAAAQAIARTVSANAADVDRLAREITQLATAVDADNRLVAALGKYQPDPTLDALKQQTGAINGSADKPDFYKSDSGTLPSLSTADKAAAALQAQIDQLDQQVKSETDQRDGLLAKADQAGEASERKRGPEGTALFTQGADARKQAADLNVKIESDNAQLARARTDLALQAGQQAALHASLAQVDAKASQVNESWTAIGEQVKGVKAHSQAQFGDAETVPGVSPAAGKQPATINAKAGQLAAVVKRNAALRSDGESHYNAARGFYKDAYTLASTLKQDLSTRLNSPDRPDRADRQAWTDQRAAIDPSTYQFLQATTQLDRAEFFAGAAAEADRVAGVAAAVKPVLDAAGLTVPVTLADAAGDGQAAGKARTLAGDGFKDAVENLTNVGEGDAPPELKQGALADKAFAQYGWSLLTAAAGDGAAAKLHLDAAKTARDSASAEGAYLPTVPPELVVVAIAPPAGTTPAGGAPPPPMGH